MPGPVISKPSVFPDWVKPENASVFDPAYRTPIRALVKFLGLDDPQQIMAVGTALEPPGGEVGGILGQLAEKFPRLAKAIKAYHGSPHDFEKFSTEQIGTGEGAQVYGHGLYFAENEGVARSYRAALAQQGWTDRTAGEALYDHLAERGIKIGDKVPFGPNQTLYSREDLASGFGSGRFKMLDLSTGLQQAVTARMPKGKMYEVSIHADPEHFVDWDKPLAQQSPHVQAAAQRAGIQPGDLNDWHNDLHNGGDRALAAQGIPGIKYLDQGSRLTAVGTRNYVVFDDKLIDIMRKYGVLLPLTGAGAQAAQQEGR